MHYRLATRPVMKNLVRQIKIGSENWFPLDKKWSACTCMLRSWVF